MLRSFPEASIRAIGHAHRTWRFQFPRPISQFADVHKSRHVEPRSGGVSFFSFSPSNRFDAFEISWVGKVSKHSNSLSIENTTAEKLFSNSSQVSRGARVCLRNMDKQGIFSGKQLTAGYEFTSYCFQKFFELSLRFIRSFTSITNLIRRLFLEHLSKWNFFTRTPIFFNLTNQITRFWSNHFALIHYIHCVFEFIPFFFNSILTLIKVCFPRFDGRVSISRLHFERFNISIFTRV